MEPRAGEDSAGKLRGRQPAVATVANEVGTTSRGARRCEGSATPPPPRRRAALARPLAAQRARLDALFGAAEGLSSTLGAGAAGFREGWQAVWWTRGVT